VGGNSVKAGAKKFASALTVHPTLEWLELGANNIDDDCADELSWALASAECTLTHLDLSRNDLTSACCEELAEALRANTKLRSLDVATCRIGDEGAAMLKEAVEVRGAARGRLASSAVRAAPCQSGACAHARLTRARAPFPLARPRSRLASARSLSSPRPTRACARST
jgi:hypothetical protein